MTQDVGGECLSEAREQDADASSSTSPPRKRRKSPPTSLPDHFRRKGHLSVSDLIGPSWCEYSYQYGVLSMSHLPPSQRPQSIKTETGQTLTASTERVQEREKILVGGRAVHTVLERQVAPEQVIVTTESREDTWALRLLNIWCSVQALLALEPSRPEKGKKREGYVCVREIPVYGWIHGVLVMGVIDEIEKRSRIQPTKNSQTKTWSSQEDWKREQQRKPKLSPSKKKAGTKGHATLTSFFQAPTAPSDTTQEPDKEEQIQRWDYYLSDTKTRIASWLPEREEQYGSRMQCMTYRRLFDGLCLGALLAQVDDMSTDQGASSGGPIEGSFFDPNATPMDWSRTFAAENLDQNKTLSDAFLADAIPLCESWNVDLLSFAIGQCTLDHIRLLLEDGLRQVLYDARKGQGQSTSAAQIAVLQSELALNYRQQKRYRGKRKAAAKQSSLKARKTQIQQEPPDMSLPQTTLDALLLSNVDKETQDSQLSETPFSSDAVSDEVKADTEALDGHNDVLAAISQSLSQPSSSPKKPLIAGSSEANVAQMDPDVQDSSQAENEAPSSSTIGIVRFQHSPENLEAHLSKMLAMWKGERQLRGVSLSQTKRCWKCEWRDGCEWRTKQSDSALQQSAARLAKRANVDKEEKQAGTQGEAAVEEDEEGFWEGIDYTAIELKDQTGNFLDW